MNEIASNIRSIVPAGHDRQGASGIGQRLRSGLHRFVEHRRRARTRRQAIRELSALSNHPLDDIGVSRADIPQVVDATLRGEARPRSRGRWA